MSVAPGVQLRPASRDDAPALGALLESLLATSPYESLVRSRLEAAFAAPATDPLAITALVLADAHAVRGLALHGFVAGAEHAGALYFVGVAATHRGQGYGRALVRAAVEHLARDGARFVIAEMPGDATLHVGETLLRGESFAPEARIRDLYREGVDLVILRRWLRPG